MPQRRRKRPWGYDSRGAPGVLMLPGCLTLVLLACLPVLVPDLMERCVGRTLDPPRGKAGVVYMAVEAACSPLLFFGPGREIALGLTLVALLIAVWWSRRWIKAHQAHWNVIRARERERRAEKRRLRQAGQSRDN